MCNCLGPAASSHVHLPASKSTFLPVSLRQGYPLFLRVSSKGDTLAPLGTQISSPQRYGIMACSHVFPQGQACSRCSINIHCINNYYNSSMIECSLCAMAEKGRCFVTQSRTPLLLPEPEEASSFVSICLFFLARSSSSCNSEE